MSTHRLQLLGVEYVNPFLESIRNVFQTMFGESIVRGPLTVATEPAVPHSITALVGMTGRVHGSVALSMPVATALKTTGLMLGAAQVVVDDSVWDAVGELANMITGGAKSALPGDQSNPVRVTVPTIIRGSDYRLEHPTRMLWLDIPFTCALGPFNVRVAIELEPPPHKAGETP
jgi:chemotaxis protein CheX